MKYPRFFADSEKNNAWEKAGILYVKVNSPGERGVLYYKNGGADPHYRDYSEQDLDRYVRGGIAREVLIEEAVLIS